jgi:hypothetical protein
MLRRTIAVAGVAIMVLAIVTVAVLFLSDNERPCLESLNDDVAVANTQKYADTIIDAIVDYHEDNQAFPNRLHELVPKYLPAIDPPDAGHSSWHYVHHRNGGDASITFGFGCYTAGTLYPGYHITIRAQSVTDRRWMANF